MSEIKITVTAPEITEAINALANAIRSGAIAGGANLFISPDTTAEVALPNPTNRGFAQPTATVAGTQTNVSYHSDAVESKSIDLETAPMSGTPKSSNDVHNDWQRSTTTHTPIVAVNEPAIAPASGQAIPTAAPQYTLEMIAKAGTALIDAGKMNELTALLARYGVEALTTLDPAHYGTFANELRALGASI